MDITKFSLEKDRIIILLVFAFVVFGIISFFTLPKAEDPPYFVRTAVVSTQFPGASAKRIEELVTDKLEKAIQEIPELDYIESESKPGLSIIYVNILEKYFDLQPIWDEVRRKVERTEPELPEACHKPFVDDEFGDVFGTIITVSADGFSYREIYDVADSLRDNLLRLNNVAKVDMYGKQDERIFVEFDNAVLSRLKLSPYQLKTILENLNIILPSGNVRIDKERIYLEPTGDFENIEEIKNTVINIPNTNRVSYLGDILKIHRGYIDPPIVIVHSTGKKAVALAVSLKDGGNIIDLGKEVRKELNSFKNSSPVGFEFNIVAMQPDFVSKDVNGFANTLLQSVIVVMALMLVFLGLRTGLIIAGLIPVAILTTFSLMEIFEIGIDKVSLAALIIALGMLVDNAIVISESILVKMNEGIDKTTAILESSKELRLPLLVATLATTFAFLPIFLAESTVGEFTEPLFQVVAICLLSSWIWALTAVPVSCHNFLQFKELKEEKYDGKYYQKYRNLLIFILKNPKKIIIIATSLLIFSFFIFQFIPKIFFPSSDRSMFTIELELPVGTAIERTTELTSEVEKYLGENFLINKKRKKGIKNWSTYIGKGAPRFVLSHNPEPTSAEYSILILNTTSFNEVKKIMPKIRKYLFETYPDLKPVVSPAPLGPQYDAPIEIRILGKNENKLFDIADKVKNELSKIKGTINISDNWGKRIKKVIVKINTPNAIRAGITNKDIAISMQNALAGRQVSTFREKDELIPLMFRTEKKYRDKLSKIKSINVYSQANGNNVPLAQVADISLAFEPSKIQKRDRLKTVTIEAHLDNGYTPASVMQKITPWLKKEEKNWDYGYFWQTGGEREESSKANKSIQDKLPITSILIAFILVYLFNSLKKAMIIALTVPLALIGVIFGLFLLRSSFGFMAFLGVISLAGIVTNNALVLLERIEIDKRNYPDDQPRAIIEAGQRRLRPILLTATTTIGGLVPLFLSFDPLWNSMAITLIFGLAFSTILTLCIVPMYYSLLYGMSFKDFKY